MVTLSIHAHTRCSEMAVPIDEVESVMRSPEISYPSPAKYGESRLISVGGRLAVVHSADGAVITVLWRGRDSR